MATLTLTRAHSTTPHTPDGARAIGIMKHTAYALIQSLTYSLVDVLTHSLTYSLTHLSNLLTYSLTYLSCFTHSPTCFMPSAVGSVWPPPSDGEEVVLNLT